MRKALFLLPLLVGCATMHPAMDTGGGGYVGMVALHPEFFETQALPPYAADSLAVHKAGTETVTGAKTFNNSSNSFIGTSFGVNGQAGTVQGLSASGSSTVIKAGNSSSFIYLSNGSYFYGIFQPAGFTPPAVALATCAAGFEWTVAADTLSGIATGKRSKLCLCTSDGSSAYKWQNMVTATLGTATTCGTE